MLFLLVKYKYYFYVVMFVNKILVYFEDCIKLWYMNLEGVNYYKCCFYIEWIVLCILEKKVSKLKLF